MPSKKKVRLNFIAGLIMGIVVMLIVGLVVFVLARHNISKINNQNQGISQQTPTPEQPTIYSFDISKADYILGQFEAPVTMVVFSDLGCSYSADFHQTYLILLKDNFYQDKVRIVWRYFPLDSIHPQARSAAVAAECAGAQSNFWPFVDQLFAHQQDLDNQFYTQTATQLNLDLSSFESCLTDQITHDIIEANYQEGLAKDVRGTPVNFINGKMLKGAIPLEDLKIIINSELGI